MRWQKWLPMAAGLAVLVALPAIASDYALSFLILLFLAVSLAQSWNLLSGLTGYFSLGHGLFFGVGTYATTVLMVRSAVPFWPALLAGAVVALLVAAGLGLLLLRTRVRIAYFAIVTLGLNEICRVIVLNSEYLGTSAGFTLPPISRIASYYAVLVLAAGATALVWGFRLSRTGLGLSAIRQDEEVAEAMGVNTSALKVRAFVMSAIVPALAGGLMARYWSYVDPYMAFDLLVSFNMAIIAVFGGVGTVWGPVLGAGVIVGATELLWTKLPRLHGLVFGLLLLAVVLVAPGGLWSLVVRGRRARAAWEG